MRTWIALPVLLISLTGCVSQTQVTSMTVGKSEASALHYSQGFHENMQVASVTGGYATNKKWSKEITEEGFRIALRESLSNAMLLGLANSAQYKINVRFIEMDRTHISVNRFTTNTTIEYTVIDSKTGNVVFDETVSTPGSATFTDSAIAARRARLANEANIRENIRLFLQGLSQKIL